MTTIKVLYTSTEIVREKFIENTVVTVARLSIGLVCFIEVDGVFFLVSDTDGGNLAPSRSTYKPLGYVGLSAGMHTECINAANIA